METLSRGKVHWDTVAFEDRTFFFGPESLVVSMDRPISFESSDNCPFLSQVHQHLYWNSRPSLAAIMYILQRQSRTPVGVPLPSGTVGRSVRNTTSPETCRPQSELAVATVAIKQATFYLSRNGPGAGE